MIPIALCLCFSLVLIGTLLVRAAGGGLDWKEPRLWRGLEKASTFIIGLLPTKISKKIIGNWSINEDDLGTGVEHIHLGTIASLILLKKEQQVLPDKNLEGFVVVHIPTVPPTARKIIINDSAEIIYEGYVVVDEEMPSSNTETSGEIIDEGYVVVDEEIP